MLQEHSSTNGYERHEPSSAATHVPSYVVDLARDLPSLKSRYSEIPAHPMLSDLPILTKKDINSTRLDLISRARLCESGSILLGSGGTTASPKVSVLPSSLFMESITQSWSPLEVGDVVVNANNGGELGSMFPFFHLLCQISGAVAIPLGGLGTKETIDTWIDFLYETKTTALAGTPTQVAAILERLIHMDIRLPSLRKVLWSGERFNASARRVVEEYGQLDLYGVYGSTETWVVGYNGPACPIDSFHVLPYQILEIVDGSILVTTVHEECLNPIVRYRIGDYGTQSSCPCDSLDKVITVGKRDDEQIKFLSILFDRDEPYEAVMALEDVVEAQIVLVNLGSADEFMEIQVVTRDHVENSDQVEHRICSSFLKSMYRLAHEVHDRPERIRVRKVNEIPPNPRTLKTPVLRMESR